MNAGARALRRCVCQSMTESQLDVHYGHSKKKDRVGNPQGVSVWTSVVAYDVRALHLKT